VADALFACDSVWVERIASDGRPHPVLTGLTGTIPDGGITCLIGPSGSGKSTLLRLLNRLEDPTRGSITFRGQDLRSFDPPALRRRVALVLQSPVMLPGTVQENLEAGLRLHGLSLPDPGAWLERLGLPRAYLQKNAQELSGGEKQRIALARTLATEPEVLLLDEVTASLDPDSTRLVEALIRAFGRPTLWISHSPEQVDRVADHVLQLESGRLKEVVRR
jgi:putative ABC transport system ATP-binding protein